MIITLIAVGFLFAAFLLESSFLKETNSQNNFNKIY
jgi:hypothetical protein